MDVGWVVQMSQYEIFRGEYDRTFIEMNRKAPE